MAIDKVEVEILAVGQGSCNVVKGINTSAMPDKQLEYLAILDAGGGNTKKSPAREAKEKLEKYLKDRATAMDGAALTDHYADLLLISHSDSDHYSIVKDIAATKASHVSTGTSGASKVSIKSTKSVFLHEDYPFSNDGNDKDVFAFDECSYTSSDCLFWYTYKAIVDGIGRYSFARCFSGLSGKVDTIRYPCATITFEVKFEDAAFNYYRKNSVTGASNLAFVVTFKKDQDMICVYVISTTTLEQPKCYSCAAMPSNAHQALLLMAGIGCEVFNSMRALLNEFNCISAAMNRFFKEPMPFTIDLCHIKKELNYLSGGVSINMTAAINTLSFGEVVTSIAKDSPEQVQFLKKKQIIRSGDIPKPAPPDGIVLNYIVNSKKVNFYIGEYGGTNNDKFDDHLRNLNSIITIVGLNGVDPQFIFPGDATVQNLWYNMIHNKDKLEGSGNNFFVLPHHGAYRTTLGNLAGESESVFSKFLEVVDPQCMYISSGYKSRHGHPNIWTMNECAKFLASKADLGCDNIVYYNKTDNERTKDFLFCKYDKPLYGTVSLQENILPYLSKSYNVIMPSYCITFQSTNASHSRSSLVVSTDTVADAALKSFPAAGGEFPETTPPALTNHPIFDFIFED